MRLPNVIAIVMALLAATAARTGTSIREWEVDEHTRGVLVQDSRAPLVGVRVEFPVGTWSRWAEQADVFTAMAILRHDPDGTLRERSDRLAARLSSGAGRRQSYVEVACLEDDLPQVLALMREVLLNADFDHGELKRWKRGAGIAWRASRRDVRFRARQLIARTLFEPGDPRRKPYDGPRRVQTDPAALARIRDLVVRVPGRIIGVWGDIDPARAEMIARELGLPEADPDSGVATAPHLRPLRPLAERDDATAGVPRLTQVYFGLGRESLPLNDPDYPASLIADHVLGGHFYSRVSVALRHERGDTYGAGIISDSDIEPGPWAVASFTRTANAASAQETLSETVRVFFREGITEEERADAASYLLGRELFSRQTPAQILARRMSELRLGLPDGFLDELPRRAAALSLEEINLFISDYYDPRGLRLLAVAPE